MSLTFLAHIADPHWLEIGLSRLKEAHPDFPWEEIPAASNLLLQRILGFSPYVTNILVRNRTFLDLFRQSPFPRPKGRFALQKELQSLLRGLKDQREVALLLRRIKQREIIKILARDLAGTNFIRTVRALTSLAEATIEVTLKWLKDRLSFSYPFLVMGMGKLGARELNYSSDIDLIYFYHGPLKAKERAAQLGQTLTFLLDQLLEGERIFRVDLRLRPGGKDGELVYTLKGGLHYYFTQAHPFERLALLKARFCGGDRRLGKGFLRALRPVIYPRYLDYSYLEHLFDLKNRLKREVQKRAQQDLKLGPGGIREIEFFVQALQMIYGGKFPSLRVRSTLWALDRLKKAALIPTQEAQALKEAYIFMRTLEHRLQSIHFRQTALLPKEPTARQRLALSMGFTEVEDFENRLKAYQSNTHQIFEALFRPSTPTKSQGEINALIEALFQGESLKEWAAKTGLPEKYLLDIRHLLKAPGALGQKKAQILRSILPDLFTHAFNHPQALGKFLSFWQRLGGRISFLHALKRHPETIEDLFLVFEKSAFLTHLLTEIPQVAEALLEPEATEKDIRQAVSKRSYETALGLLRLYRNETIFRLGLADLKGKISLEELLEALSDLALFVLQETWRITLSRLKEEKALEAPPMVVLGVGKIGSRELGYRSDLDLLFIYQGDLNNIVPATKVAQRLLFYLSTPLPEGPGYQVDTRLRPEGRKGPLAVSVEGFIHYYQKQADLWEKLALVRGRPLVGDKELCSFINQGLLKALQGAYGLQEAQRVYNMRLRMEKERTKPSSINPKVGFGGLADLEFALQWLSLKHLPEIPSLLGQSVLKSTTILEQAGFLTREQAYLIKNNYLFLRTLEQKLILLLDKSGEEKEYSPHELDLLTPYLGQDVYQNYQQITRQNRSLLRDILGLPPQGLGKDPQDR